MDAEKGDQQGGQAPKQVQKKPPLMEQKVNANLTSAPPKP
jgi:hypothetical protein